MNKAVYEARRDKLRQKMFKHNLDCMLVSYAANRYYLSGFELHDVQCNESAGYLVIDKNGKDHLFTDSRYLEAAKELWDENYIHIYKNAAYELNTFLQNKGKIGFEAKCICLDFFDVLSQNLVLEAADGLIEAIRLIKDDSEIDAMIWSCALNQKMMQWLPSVLDSSKTEKQIALEIEFFFKSNGASELSFASIVASGKNAALPHYSPSDKLIAEDSMLLVDVGARLDNYCSDQTRTFWIGSKPSDQFKTVYDRVQEAQTAAINALRPGLKVKEAYDIAYKCFEKYKVQDHFTHALGHGIGIETHEMPSLNPRMDFTLQPGMFVTVEPGLYYPEWGGVRIEHMVLITQDGNKSLTIKP